MLELRSSSDVAWEPRLDRKFLPVRRPTHKHEILLVGLETELPYFEKESGDEPESTLLVVAKKRDQTLNDKETKRWEEYLLREKWKPENFQSAGSNCQGDSISVTLPDGWKRVQGLGFSLSAPAGWEYHELAGVDSYLGEFTGDGIVLHSDLGAYSDSLDEEREPEYVVIHKSISGFCAKIISPKMPGHGVTGIYFPNLSGTIKLSISAKDLT